MYLKTLEMQGFKSFPDKTKMDFGRKVTVIVGPNGSGKSNISDAVRWALGEQSAKSLRGGKMEDVIFNGAAERNPHGFAEVCLTIDNSDGTLISQDPEKPYGDEVTVSRKYYRNGESEYRINSEIARLKDVHEIFLDTGLGKDGYSIIGQGRIAEIVSSKPVQRREMFEEAAGISKFRLRKEEAEKRLELAQENVLRLTDILSELESRVEPLRVQSVKAEKFLKLSEAKKTLEISLWVEDIRKLQRKIAEREDRILLVRDDYEKAEKEYDEIEKEIDKIFSSTQSLTAEVEEIRRRSREIEGKVNENESETAVLKNDIQHNERSIEKADEEISQSKLENDDIEKSCEAAQKEIAEEEGKREKIFAEKEIIENKLLQIENEEKEISENLLKSEEYETELGKKCDTEKFKLASAQMDVSKYGERIGLLESSSKEREEKIVSFKKELSEVEDLLEAIDENIESLENSSNGIKMKMSSRTEKLSKIENERNGKLREAEDKLRRAKVLEDLEKSMEGFSGSVKYILSQSKSGYLPGICGTVSNILSVEKEYAVAIETAIGGALQNIVTENEEAAKKAINKLKASGAGRATFLPLTAIKGRELKEAGVEKNKGFVGFAWKMVNYDAKYDNIVMSLLGKIVVAENIDFAVDIAKKYNYGFKIVTLDGQLVNAGGSMTGGSVVAGTGLLSRKSEIDSLKKQAEDIRKKIEAADGDYNLLKEEVAALNANLVAVESEIKTCGEDKIRYEAEKKRIKMSLDDVEKSGAESVKQIELLKVALKDAENRSEENRKSFEAAQKELEDAKQKRDELREELSSLHDRNVSFIGEISDIKSAISDVEKNIEIKKMAVEQLKNQSVEREEKANLRIEEKQRLIEENERIKDQIKKIQEENAELLSEVAGSEKSIETILKERMRLEGENGKLRSEQKEVSIRKEGLSAELVRQEESKKNYVAENDAIIERMLNDYEMTQTQAEQIAQKVENYTESQKKLSGIRSEIKSLGNVNLSAIEEYKEVSERYEFLKGQLDDVERSSKEIRSLIEKLVGQMKDIFNDKFKRISENFTKIFAELFEGGTGALKLTEGEDVLEAGIEIYAAPPGKIINSLSSLSGGEQALVAIAVYFSMLKESPAPFCILDEIEAALDDVNVNRYVQYLKKMNEYIQFIAVSHRRGTMDNADVLYGVTMQERGVSKILKLDVDEIESKLNMKV